jgi:hypothetical protein
MELTSVSYEDIQISAIKVLNESLDEWKRSAPALPVGLEKGRYPLEIVRALDYIEGLHLAEADLFRLGIVETSDGLQIASVGIEEFIGPKKILVHQGFVDSYSYGEWDNLRQLQQEGIFGGKSGATYLAPLTDTSVAPNFVFPEDRQRRIPIVAYVNPAELAKWRKVYIDPEQQMERKNQEDIPKNAIFITGGIPAEAIINFSGKVDPGLF